MGATTNNTGGHLKIRGTWKNSNMRGRTKFLGGLIEIEGARLSGGLLQRGVSMLKMKSTFAQSRHAWNNRNDL